MRPIGPRTVVFSLADFRADLRGIGVANELEFDARVGTFVSFFSFFLMNFCEERWIV